MNGIKYLKTIGLINLFRLLMLYLKPVLPIVAEKTERFLNIKPLQWQDAQTTLLNHKINKFETLMTRVEKEKIDAMVENSKGNFTKT